MKIGVFDSGLGGLIVVKSFIEKLTKHDFLYLGDTKNLPYGEKSNTDVLKMTIDAMEFLIKNDCKIIIIACNTATSVALRHLQQIYVPKLHPDIKILGVVVPTVEEAIKNSAEKIGVVATSSTIKSQVYKTEINKINPNIIVEEISTPNLVPLIESNDLLKADEEVEKYVKKFGEIDSLILGCTHYPILKESFKKHLPKVDIISQYEFMGEKLQNYLSRHTEINELLSKNMIREYYITKYNESYMEMANIILGNINIKEIEI